MCVSLNPNTPTCPRTPPEEADLFASPWTSGKRPQCSCLGQRLPGRYLRALSGLTRQAGKLHWLHFWGRRKLACSLPSGGSRDNWGSWSHSHHLPSTRVNRGNTLRHPHLDASRLFINGLSYFHRFMSQTFIGHLPHGWLCTRSW